VESIAWCSVVMVAASPWERLSRSGVSEFGWGSAMVVYAFNNTVGRVLVCPALNGPLLCSLFGGFSECVVV